MKRTPVVVMLGLCVLVQCSCRPRQAGDPGGQLTLDLGTGVTMKLRLIPAGRFMMGKGAPADRAPEEGPAREVIIGKAFYMGVYEVTQEQYRALMGENPSHFRGSQRPVECVSWDDAVEFCKRLSARTGRAVRLPTEAQWEYACRAGTKTRFSFGDADAGLEERAWCMTNGGGETHRVGLKKPNAWGLCDMHGNVYEWCADWYSAIEAATERRDPGGPGAGARRVLRGGGWYCIPLNCLSGDRDGFAPDDWNDDVGFRVVVDSR